MAAEARNDAGPVPVRTQVHPNDATRVTRVAVLEKAFALLEAMDRTAAPQPLRGVAALTGLPKATAFRLLQTLVELGYAAQDPVSCRYRLTMRLAELGRSTRYDGLVARAQPHLERLHAEFDETTNLAVLEGTHVTYLLSLETTQALRWIVRPGTSDAFHSTALGRAMVAYLPQREREALLAQAPFHANTDRTPTDAAALQRILDQVRAQGWAIDDEHNAQGVTCLAVPLLDGNAVLAAISVSVPRTRLSDELASKVVRSLLDVARRWRGDRDRDRDVTVRAAGAA